MYLYILFLSTILNSNLDYYSIECKGDYYSILAHIEQNNDTLLIDYILINEQEESILIPCDFQNEETSISKDEILLSFNDVSKNAIPPKGIFLNYSFLPPNTGRRFVKKIAIKSNVVIKLIKVSLDYHSYTDIVQANIKTYLNEGGVNDGIIKMKVTKKTLKYFYGGKEKGEAYTYYFDMLLDRNKNWNNCQLYPHIRH